MLSFICLFRWWIRRLKSEEFQSVYLSEKYQSFGNEKNAKDLSNNTRLAEAQKRAQAFVDRCEQVEKQNNQEAIDFLKQMQWDELKTVFDYARK
jgi:predicted metal-dependent hydrolase